MHRFFHRAKAPTIRPTSNGIILLMDVLMLKEETRTDAEKETDYSDGR